MAGIAGIAGIQEAYVHGSCATRYHGEAGGPPGDIDVVVVGHPSRREVDGDIEDLDTRLGREVNITYLSTQRWQDDDDMLVTTVPQSG